MRPHAPTPRKQQHCRITKACTHRKSAGFLRYKTAVDRNGPGAIQKIRAGNARASDRFNRLAALTTAAIALCLLPGTAGTQVAV